ncbi:MAG: hypothetical protein WC728_19020 [Elusimicrobiota bacterium]
MGVIRVMAGSAILGVVPLSVGVIVHEGSTILVCLLNMLLPGLPISDMGLKAQPKEGR